MDRRKYCAVNQMKLCSLENWLQETGEQIPLAAMVSLQHADLSYKRTLGNKETGSKRSAQSFLLNWNILALQSCGRFCCTALWISHMYTYIPSLFYLPPTTTPSSHPSRLSQSLGLSSLCYTVTPHQLSILDRVKLYFAGLQNPCRWWLQPWN